MTKELKNIFGIDFEAPDGVYAEGLENEENITFLRAFSCTFMLVEIPDDQKFGAVSLEKKLHKFEKRSGMDVAFVFSSLNKIQRNALTMRHIPFICLPEQMFLPFLGIALTDHFKKKKEIPTDKMMPATQTLFLYLLYSWKIGSNKQVAARAVDLTKTSITRASEQLRLMNLIKEEQKGTEKTMKTVAEGMELALLAEPYLIDPVQKRIYVEYTKELNAFPLAGESALRCKAISKTPDIPVIAMYKGDALIKELRTVDVDWEREKKIVAVELWKYDPLLFTKENIVDPVSLKMSLGKDIEDRINDGLKDYFEDYLW